MTLNAGLLAGALAFAFVLAAPCQAADAVRDAPAPVSLWLYWPVVLLLTALVWRLARPVHNPWARGVIWGAVATLLLTPVSLGTGDDASRGAALEHLLTGIATGDGARASLAMFAAFKLWPLFAIGCGLMERVLAPRRRPGPREQGD